MYLSYKHLALLSVFVQLEHPGMRPDAHQGLVVGEETGASGEALAVFAERAQVLLVQLDLQRGQAHRDDVLVLGRQQLGDIRVVFALKRMPTVNTTAERHVDVIHAPVRIRPASRAECERVAS